MVPFLFKEKVGAKNVFYLRLPRLALLRDETAKSARNE